MMGLARVAAAAAAVCALAAGVSPAQAGTNTLKIVVDTVKAAPACMAWRPSGVCFWLQCKGLKCSIRTSLRVSHYNPDVVVSTWHQSMLHPWTDYGAPLATSATAIGTGLTGVLIDSAGTRSRDDRRDRNGQFRDADAIGNPLGGLSGLLKGSIAVPSNPTSMSFPNAQGQSTPIPLPSLASIANGAINAIPGVQTARNVIDTAQSVNSVVNGAISVQDILGGGFSAVGITGFCNSAATPFVPHYHGMIDALAWRGIAPVDMIYPASLVPGMREVGNWPANTWGNVYPRTGMTTQQHPVKAAAVIAQRAGDIVTREGQPHVYLSIGGGGTRDIGGQRVWLPPPLIEGQASTGRWQMLAPKADNSCSTFGANDAFGITSWGDDRTVSTEGYSWNLWRPYSCCDKAGQTLLGTVAF